MQLQQVLHTLRFLKLQQLYYQVYYRIRKLIRQKLGFEYALLVEKEGQPLHFKEWILKAVSYEQASFNFLNQKRVFENESGLEVNWDDETHGKLWAYNLNYMDFLLQPDMKSEEGFRLIELFIEDFPKNRNGKEPYPIALRGINWIKFLSKHASLFTDSIRYSDVKEVHLSLTTVNNSLYAQYLILLDNLEYHLLGNHLLEDAYSLLFGAFYFEDEQFYSKAKELLVQELEEQILQDGAHFELSPMYHQILLDRLLDCINLLQNNSCFEEQEHLLSFMTGKAEKMLFWLECMIFSDGSIPLFNDSTNGIAPTSKEILEYAHRLGLPEAVRLPQTTDHGILSDSGYRRFDGKQYECIVDVGNIGPDYIPGHAHADTFNFALQVNGKPVIVDTGISTYNKNEVRQAERGTAAHNTVVVNNTNQSDVWGGFRVGKRVRIIQIQETENSITTIHDGYKALGCLHQRSFSWIEDEIVIQDVLKGKTEFEAIAHLHLHPSKKPLVKGMDVILNDCVISFENAHRISIEPYFHALGFNKQIKASKIIVVFSNNLKTYIKIR